MLKGDLPKDDKVGTTESTKDVWDSWLSFAGEEKPPEVGQVSPSPRPRDPVVPTVKAAPVAPVATTAPVTKVVASGSVTSQELIPGDEKMTPADPEEVEKDEENWFCVERLNRVLLTCFCFGIIFVGAFAGVVGANHDSKILYFRDVRLFFFINPWTFAIDVGNMMLSMWMMLPVLYFIMISGIPPRTSSLTSCLQDATEMRDTPTSQVAVAGQKASKSLEKVVVVEEVQASEEEEVTWKWKSWIFFFQTFIKIYFRVFMYIICMYV